jgi:hypothetical protein
MSVEYRTKSLRGSAMTRRTVLFAAAGVVVVAAVVAGLVFFTGSEGSADPNETAVTDMCRDAAQDWLGKTKDMKDFAVDEMTHEARDGFTFYRALGSATTSDGFGGDKDYTFECRTRIVPKVDRLELLNIVLV